MDHARGRRRAARCGFATIAAGGTTALAGPWILGSAFATATLFGAAAAPIAAGAVLVGLGVRLVRRNHHHFRFSQTDAIRRYALGYVVETALAGKGVVSLERVTQFIQSRAGRVKVRRATVESALRQLSIEFEAPITRQGGDLFFGFRNVKRQFLASHLMRRQLGLGTTVSGGTVFDTEDSREIADKRELDAFDRALKSLPVNEGSQRPTWRGGRMGRTNDAPLGPQIE